MEDRTLKVLCRRFASHFGCPVLEKDPDLWFVELPASLKQHKAFARRGRLILAFHRDLLSTDPTAQLVAPGSPIVVAMADALQSEGTSGELWLKPNHPLPQAMPGSVSVVGGSLAIKEARQVYRTIIKVQFKAIFDGPERTVEFFPVVLDGQTLGVADKELEFFLAQAEDAGCPQDGKVLGMRVQEVLERAYHEAENRALPVLVHWEKRADAASSAEKLQASTFYQGQIAEAADRRAELERYRDLRMREIDQRHTCSLELEARNAILVRLPLARVELIYRNGLVERPLVVDVDRVTGRWNLPTCSKHPTADMTRFGICANHTLACERCIWSCGCCQQTYCRDCPSKGCSKCLRKCGACCTTLCSACGQSLCMECSNECTTKTCGPVCDSCSLVVGGRKRCRKCAVVAACGHPSLNSQVSICSVDGASFCRLPECSGLCRNHGTVCATCSWSCDNCQETYCNDCSSRRCGECKRDCGECCSTDCSTCGGIVCSTCSVQCNSKGCGLVCKGCTITVAGKARCKNCAVNADCGHSCLKSKLITCSVDKATFCAKPGCAPSAVSCSACGQCACKDHTFKCAGSGEIVCFNCKSDGSLPGGRLVCKEHSRLCDCGALALRGDIDRCAVHKCSCPECRWYCIDCDRPCCSRCYPVPCVSCTEALHCEDCSTECCGCEACVPIAHCTECAACSGKMCNTCIVSVRNSSGNTILCCRRCTKACECGHAALRIAARECSSGHSLCAVCSSDLSVCPHCSKSCCSKHREICSVKGETVCSSCGSVSLKSGGLACKLHAGRCDDCNKWFVNEDLKTSCDHGRLVCAGCAWSCDGCHLVQSARTKKFGCKVCRKRICAKCKEKCIGCESPLCRAHVCDGCGQSTCRDCQSDCERCGTTLCGKCLAKSKGVCLLCKSLKSVNGPQDLPALNFWRSKEGKELVNSRPSWKLAESKNRYIIEAHFTLTIITLSFVNGILANRIESKSILGVRFGIKKS